MSEVLDLESIRDVQGAGPREQLSEVKDFGGIEGVQSGDLDGAIDSRILIYAMTYEVVCPFGPETRHFLPHTWACTYAV